MTFLQGGHRRHGARWNARSGIIVLTSVMIALLLSCSSLNQLMKEGVKKPHVKVANVRMSGLSFDAVDLLFDVNISNPNSLGIKLAGFDYDFGINDFSFLTGNNSDGIDIGANGSHDVQIPISVRFTDLYRTVQSLANEDSSGYSLKTGFSFQLPVLGAVRVPVSKSGSIPLLKLPSINLGALKLNRLNFTGADLELAIKVKNPNAFSMNIQQLVYDFAINGRSWGSGQSSSGGTVVEKGESLVKIPISLNFLEMGRSVFDLINGNTDLDYRLNGNVNLGSSLPLLPATQLNFDKNGQVQISR